MASGYSDDRQESTNGVLSEDGLYNKGFILCVYVFAVYKFNQKLQRNKRRTFLHNIIQIYSWLLVESLFVLRLTYLAQKLHNTSYNVASPKKSLTSGLKLKTQLTVSQMRIHTICKLVTEEYDTKLHCGTTTPDVCILPRELDAIVVMFQEIFE